MKKAVKQLLTKVLMASFLISISSSASALGVEYLDNIQQAQKFAGEDLVFMEFDSILLLMGSRFEISVLAVNEQSAYVQIEAAIEEVRRIEKLISSWDENSQTSAINRQAGIKPTVVDEELFELIRRALKIAELTSGAFDISTASMQSIWKFDGSMDELPPPDVIASSVLKVDYHNIITDSENRTVYLKQKGMRIGFGGIGKGYAANRVAAMLQSMGVDNGLINAGGDLYAWGTRPNDKPWTIGIADPVHKNKVAAWLEIRDAAVVTSGDYERFVEFDGKRYAHIIDPQSGYPTTGIKSVTVICTDAELADALATSVFVMGVDKGMELINALEGIECLIVTDSDDLISSDHMQLHYYQNKGRL